MRKAVLVVSIVAMFAGCANPRAMPPITFDELLERAGPMPTDAEAKEIAMAHLTESLKDPGSIKQFAVYQSPQPMQFNSAGRYAGAWLICFQYNAKNSYGGYVGLTRDGVVVKKNNGVIEKLYINWNTTNSRC